MKIVYLMDKSTYPVDDDIAEQMMQNIDKLSFIKLPNGAFINKNQITKIVEPEKAPYFLDSPMTADLRYVLKNGERIQFDQRHKDRIEWREEPNSSLKQIN